MFKISDIVIFIGSANARYLTYGKSYLVIDTYVDTDFLNRDLNRFEIYIKDDSGHYDFYPEILFVSLKEYRKQKLQKLCL